MKKLISLLLCLLLVFPLCACMQPAGKLKAPVNFYYLQTTNENGNKITKICSEEREAYGHKDDLNYLLMLYMTGPADPQLHSPFPQNARLMELSIKEDSANILLRGMTFDDLSKLEVSLCCACIAKTCFSLSELKTVNINTEAGKLSGTANIIIHRDDIMIADEYASVETVSE